MEYRSRNTQPIGVHNRTEVLLVELRLLPIMNGAASRRTMSRAALDAADANVHWRPRLHLGKLGRLTSDRVSFHLQHRRIVARATKK